MSHPTIDASFVAAAARRILTGPPKGNKRFDPQDPSAARIYAMAARIRQAARGEAPLCLGCPSREVTAAALLAGLAGGPPLVLPPDFSPSLLETLHRMTGFQALVTDGKPPADPPCPVLNPAAGPDPAPLPADGPMRGAGEIWAWLFTGGSTGTPRLWSKTVGNLLGEAAFQAGRLGLGPADTILTTVPGYHIYGLLFTVLAPLIAGARVVSATPAFPAEIATALSAEKATVLVSVPAHYRLLAGHLGRTASLRLALSSAGPLPPEDGAAFSRATGVVVEEVYGSTETGGIATRRRASGERALTPFAVLDWAVEQERLKVRSPFLSPELPRDGEGYFHTADRVAPDGPNGFTVLGRTDGVVKVGGRRVELEAVRGQLLALAGVEDAFVFARPAAGGRQNDLLALVQTELEPAAIRARLQAGAPAWALPRTIRSIAAIPLTAAGKYDRQAIEALFASAAGPQPAGGAKEA